MFRFLKKKKITCESILRELRRGGAKIGNDVVVVSPYDTTIDKTSPWMLTIGDHVRIAAGVRILTHDYAWSVLKHDFGRKGTAGCILGAQSPVDIGNCVFIGMNAIITRGVKIGSHVIIGAGSVVTKDCEDGGVYAGNPAKRIMSIEQYYEKRKACQIEDAKIVARRYLEQMGTVPPVEIFTEYFMLFLTRQEAERIPEFRKQMALLGNYDETVAFMDKNPPVFPGYEAFLKECRKEKA